MTGLEVEHNNAVAALCRRLGAQGFAIRVVATGIVVTDADGVVHRHYGDVLVCRRSALVRGGAS